MRVLLDTHCWLWALAAPERLTAEARGIITDRANDVFLSAACAWEISIKHALGKLVLPVSPEEYVSTRLASQGLLPLPIQVSHALRAGALPPHHRDPFDRLLVAQSQLDGLKLITADEQLRPYDVELLWASASNRPE